MKIEIWSDIACPFCYIGKKRFEAALERFDYKDQVEVIYKAYQLDPSAPKVMSMSAESYISKQHGVTEEEALEKFKVFTENGLTVGLQFDYKNIHLTNSFDAHRVLKWSREFDKEEELSEVFMNAYFVRGLNIADFDVIKELVIEIGLDGDKAIEVLQGDLFIDVVKEEIEESSAIGVQGVPFFVINRKYGISGAQSEEYFFGALTQIYAEENRPKNFNISESSGGCCGGGHHKEEDSCGCESSHGDDHECCGGHNHNKDDGCGCGHDH